MNFKACRRGGACRTLITGPPPRITPLMISAFATTASTIVPLAILSPLATRCSRLDLEPGEISLHHVRLVHGSPANTSDDRRIGFAIRYIPTHLRQLFGDDSASLVRGEDRAMGISSWNRAEARPGSRHAGVASGITERNAKIVYRGTDVESYNDPRAVGVR